MISIVYSATTSRDVQQKLGKAEYSYYFVLKEFVPVLEAFGPVIVVTDPAQEVDPIYRESRARGEECFFFSFTPPNLTTLGLDCPTIPVFAWEFDTIPNEPWFGERKQDWRYILGQVARAITLSEASAQAVKDAMGEGFPVASIPAPVWDRFALKSERRSPRIASAGAQFDFVGTVIDSAMVDLSVFAPEGFYTNKVFPVSTGAQIALAGVIYLSIFNPADGRKNWPDLIAGFCRAFRDVADATLVLKLTHHEHDAQLTEILEWLHKLGPMRCRVILVTGFLEAEQYEALVGLASYVVNASYGEGQCLPVMEGMARGKPAVAPCHSAMADYIYTPQAFVVRSSAESTSWPHDARAAHRTLRYRIDFESLVEAYQQSYIVAKEDPARYARMSENASEAIRQQASISVAVKRLRALLETPAHGQYGRVAQANSSP